jgi:hypothetical protein
MRSRTRLIVSLFIEAHQSTLTCTYFEKIFLKSRAVAALVSLFSIHVSEFHSRAKWPVWFKTIPRFRSTRWSEFLQAEGVRQSEIHRHLGNVCGQVVFSRKEVPVWRNKFEDGRMTLGYDPEKHRGRPRTTHTDGNSSIIEGLLRKDGRVRLPEAFRSHVVPHIMSPNQNHE